MPERERYDHSHFRSELERSKSRLKDLEERGVEAMSRYDIEIAHGGDAEAALRMAKGLVSNHVAYFSRKLEELGPEVRQTDMFGGLMPAPETRPETRDEEATLERAITHDFYDPPEDDHLEDAYDMSQGEGEYDYDGFSSEE